MTTLEPPIHQSPEALSPSYIKRCVRVAIDATRGFINDDCYAKASSLTYYSLLSLVPIMAVLFGIAKGFGFEKALEEEIRQRFSEQQEVMSKLIEFSYSLLHNAQGGVIAGIGTAVLLWSVLGLLSSIEATMNSIWKTRISRPYNRKISDYLAITLIGPIFIISSSSLTVYITTTLKQAVNVNLVKEAVAPSLVVFTHLSPYLLSWGFFTFFYMFMPAPKVLPRAGIIAGLLAGTAFQLWQWAYIKFQIGVSSYGPVYGSFAALPLFLIWIQISWLIALFGAELAFEIENDFFVPARKLTPLSEKAIALYVTYRCIDAFEKGKNPMTDRALALELGMSLNYLQQVLEILQKERLLSAVSLKDRTTGYQPARAVETISMKNVWDAVETSNTYLASAKTSPEMGEIIAYLDSVDQAFDASRFNKTLYPLLPIPNTADAAGD